MNQTLEAMARAIFKSWFVDFDPVRAKMEGKQPVGMDAATAALFPDSFEESALGLIPRGWRIVTLKQVTQKITKGTTPTTLNKRFIDSGINFIKVQAINDKGFFIPEQFAYIDKETHHILSRSNLQKNDILYSIAGTIGRVAIVYESILPANTNQALAIIRPDIFLVEPLYLRYLLS